MKSIPAALLLLLALPAPGEESRLWGKNGENWDPAGRLPDFSYAGYACGERPIPVVPVVANVRDLGARGDGRTDDTAAFKKAIAAVAETGKPGAVGIPAGSYLVRDILEITRPGIVLRGVGAEKSWIVCDTPLEKIRPNMGHTTSGRPTSNYSWSGGIIWIKGRQAGKRIGNVTQAANRGARRLQVDNLAKAGLEPGDWVEIRLRDDASRTLLDHLYSGDPGNVSKIKAGSHSTLFTSRVRQIDGDTLSIERPLRTDLRPEWKPQLYHYDPSVRECGVEDLGFHFPPRTYKGHFTELGFNAVAMSGVADCWARRLRLVNADSGLFISGRFCTASDLHGELDGGKEAKGGVFGHHGVSLTGNDNLFTRFDFQQCFIHDITVSKGAGNVSSCGSGIDLCFDHHERAPYENLFTDIDLGKGSRMWKCGGGANLGRHCGARGTFWNIRAERPQKHPGGFGPASMNLIGIETREKSTIDPDGRWFEAVSPADLLPQNLHQAQWERRMGVMR